MSSSRSSQRSSISPLRSRKGSSSSSVVTHHSSVPKIGVRPAAPLSTSSSRLSTPSTLSSRPTTPSSVGRPADLSRLTAGHPASPTAGDRTVSGKSKENVTVTVRFRPLSAREIHRGDEIAWYADGDVTVRNEHNANIAYGFDRVFGPATTTRHVYDAAAQNVVSGAMEGINGTVFAYGVTSSGKTHTMHGEQKSPGIIPLAVKDVFNIIQETPGREFLLRVSYLEIYNEVINDLLDPTGQNLRIREDSQGTYVEGIKEEVVLSPAHALSLIASGEEHRHVGSNNFNLLSSRSHTIFTLTIESSPSGETEGEEDVTLSQLNLIDLAGSESSKTETTGLRRKEGSYINKSLLTLGTVIAKLTDGKSAHVPYRDSKLTRLLQSSLSGHGRVSLICTVTPASSTAEETHNTLKFAHRSKHVEIKAAQNKIMDEKSLIKKYQREISCLKQELQQLRQGMVEKHLLVTPDQEDIVNLKLQLEAGQVKLQSRLEEEEQAKAALMGRIQRLTKLILVSTKSTIPPSVIPPSVSGRTGYRRRHSFGEDELAYLPEKKREYLIDDDSGSLDSDFSTEGKCDSIIFDESTKLDKANKRRGVLGWFKTRKPEHISGLSTITDNDASGSPSFSQPLQQKKATNDMKCGRRKSFSKIKEDPSSILDSFPETTQAGDLFSVAVRRQRPPPTGTTITDQMDLLQEQVKMLAGEVALCTSSLKRLSEKAEKNPENLEIQAHMQRLKDEISEKQLQMHVLEQRMIGSFETNPHASNNFEMSQALSKLAAQLNEKTFELEIMLADNRILQEQLQLKTSENAEIQETVVMLRQQLDSFLERSANQLTQSTEVDTERNYSEGERCFSVSTPKSLNEESLKSQVLMQAAEIENLKQEKVRLAEEKDGLEVQSQKLSEEASYARELASAAAVELKNLAEEVTKLSYQNAKLSADLATTKELMSTKRKNMQLNGRHDVSSISSEDAALIHELQKELIEKRQLEISLEAEVIEKNKMVADLHERIHESKQRGKYLENELANMRAIIAKMKKSEKASDETVNGENACHLYSSTQNGSLSCNGHVAGRYKGGFSVDRCDDMSLSEELNTVHEDEWQRCKELEKTISNLKTEDLSGLDAIALDELHSFHVDALSKICQEKLTDKVP